MTTKVDPRPEGAAVWVYHEDLIPLAKQEFEQCLQDPHNPRYQGASQTADSIRREADRLDRQYRKNVRDLSDQLNRPNLRAPALDQRPDRDFGPRFSPPGSSYGRVVVTTLSFTVRVIDELGGRHSLGLIPILHGEVWRLITPIFSSLRHSPHSLQHVVALDVGAR